MDDFCRMNIYKQTHAQTSTKWLQDLLGSVCACMEIKRQTNSTGQRIRKSFGTLTLNTLLVSEVCENSFLGAISSRSNDSKLWESLLQKLLTDIPQSFYSYKGTQ